MFINGDGTAYRVGQVLFFAETFNTSNGVTTYSVSSHPFRTNQSHEPKLAGWCGETNNRSTTARGLVRVGKLLPNDRVELAHVPASEYATELEALGYPELAT